ncbi:hypothetical protein TI03_01775 [Achromatium sp. WMS1]|nr:hypothetical protein TI03_01775 [Achromatium sp. WMS1]
MYQILQIAVAAPVYQLFDYLPPTTPFNGQMVRGLRLWVPFGSTKRLGFLWNIATNTQCTEDKLKPALAWLDSVPLWSAKDLELLAWTAEYYQYPLGEVLTIALPTLLRQPKTKLNNLVAKDAIQVPNLQTPHLTVTPELNIEQIQAIKHITATLGKFQTFLLQGITGSGKTEVYLQLLKKILANGNQALILVPEIGLTPQMQQRLLARLNARIALLHSGQTDRTRAIDWQSARTGIADIVLGTRSAIFTPLPRLALIIVDEEHDLSFKQYDKLLYSARDLAVWRGWQRSCPVILGSATPSLETVQNTILNRYTKLILPKRAGSAVSPKMDLIDIRAIKLQAGLSPTLIGLLKKNLAAGHQSLLFLNRRGYAPLLRCYICGWVAECSHCDARLTLHKKASVLWCHHCGNRQTRPEQCPNCKNPKLSPLGQGTERLEQILAKLFTGASLARIDHDTTKRRGNLEKLLQESEAGLHSIILGTQMVAKGHHFPNLTLVGILDIEQGLYGTDYRAMERMAQLIIQVAGRAGRSEQPGHVVIQTYHPDHILLQTLIHKGYTAFTQLALEERKAARFPPFSAQVLLRAEGATAESALAFLTDAHAIGHHNLLPGIEFLGPAPASMERRAKRYRAQLLIQAETRTIIRQFLTIWFPKLRHLPSNSKVRWSLDVDPQELY